jgi:hypothetical protein
MGVARDVRTLGEHVDPGGGLEERDADIPRIRLLRSSRVAEAASSIDEAANCPVKRHRDGDFWRADDPPRDRGMDGDVTFPARLGAYRTSSGRWS